MYKVGDKVILNSRVFTVLSVDKHHKQIEALHPNREEWTLNYEDIKPYKSAHDKLIEMGWEQKMSGSNLTLYMKGDLTIYAYKKEKCVICHGSNDSQLTFIINLALSRILTQYLEELEND